MHREDRELVTASIQAIGRCASRLPEVADSCMRTLMTLIANRSEEVVAESVVVIKKLLQAGANQVPLSALSLSCASAGLMVSCRCRTSRFDKW